MFKVVALAVLVLFFLVLVVSVQSDGDTDADNQRLMDHFHKFAVCSCPTVVKMIYFNALLISNPSQKRHKKKYNNETSKHHHFERWKKRKALVDRHNAQASEGQYSFQLDDNFFADMVKSPKAFLSKCSNGCFILFFFYDF